MGGVETLQAALHWSDPSKHQHNLTQGPEQTKKMGGSFHPISILVFWYTIYSLLVLVSICIRVIPEGQGFIGSNQLRIDLT